MSSNQIYSHYNDQTFELDQVITFFQITITALDYDKPNAALP